MSDDRELTLSTMAGGAVELLFQEELARLLKNIDDPNTPAEAGRELTIRLKVKPAKSRQMAQVEIIVASKLAQHEPVPTEVFIGLDQSLGRFVALEHNPRQQRIGFGQTPPAAADDEKPPKREN